jgi:outer membrane murein-binding lipoprotein Lpp
MPDTIGITLSTLMARVEALERDARQEAGRSYAAQTPSRGIWRGEDFAI